MQASRDIHNKFHTAVVFTIMSEFSMKLHSKKGAARIQKAQKFLNDVKTEESKLIQRIQEIAKPVNVMFIFHFI